MDTNITCVAFALVIAGMIGLGLGIWTWLGKNRAWYLISDYYVLLPKGMHYALPISGLMFITLGISLFFPNSRIGDIIMYWVTFPLLAIVLLIVIFQPSWLKPKWVRWLEENHGDILEILIREGRETPNWSEKVSTQEGLEEWVEEVRRKRGLKRKRER
jgi:hypothetical protein